MQVGDIVAVVYGKRQFQVELDEQVFPDRSCGQYEAGFYAFQPGNEDEEGPEFFISMSGVVYGPTEDDPTSLTVAVGICPEAWAEARRRDQREREADARMERDPNYDIW